MKRKAAVVNWDFIGDLEGGLRLDGYVPRDTDGEVIGHSGVTIADGVDLGQQHHLGYLEEHLHDAAIERLLDRYYGVQGAMAAALLDRLPLRLTLAQARAVSDVAHAVHLIEVRRAYNACREPGADGFDDLPEAARTVIASVAYQYGDVATCCPKFWRTALARDWGAMIAELENFHDNFPTRRYKESEYLRSMVLT